MPLILITRLPSRPITADEVKTGGASTGQNSTGRLQ